MAISSDYPRPITVNGYVCRNCDDVSKAKRNVDPTEKTPGQQAAVSFGGSLAAQSRVTGPQVAQPAFALVDRFA